MLTRLIITKTNGDIVDISYHYAQRTEESVFSISGYAKNELIKWSKGNLKIEIIDTGNE